MNVTQNNDNQNAQTEQANQLTDLEPSDEVKGGTEHDTGALRNVSNNNTPNVGERLAYSQMI